MTHKENMSHTPGPWNVDTTYWGGAVPPQCPEWNTDNKSVMAGLWSICMVQADNDKPMEANAHLIAAAPDLLEACKEIRKSSPNSSWIHEVVDKAIDKALGWRAHG